MNSNIYAFYHLVQSCVSLMLIFFLDLLMHKFDFLKNLKKKIFFFFFETTLWDTQNKVGIKLDMVSNRSFTLYMTTNINLLNFSIIVLKVMVNY